MSDTLKEVNEEIAFLMSDIIKAVEDNKFLNSSIYYDKVLEYKIYKQWEDEVKKFGSEECRIVIPLAVLKAIDFNPKLSKKVLLFIRYTLLLVLRLFNKLGDIKSIQYLIFLAADNIDTWLLKRYNLRRFSFIHPQDKDLANKYIQDRFMVFDGMNNPKTSLKIAIDNFEAIVDTALVIEKNTKNGVLPLDEEKDFIASLILDFITSLFTKARGEGDNIRRCSYCGTIYYHTRVQKENNSFLGMSDIEKLCSECFVEVNKDKYSIRDIYIQNRNARNNIELKYYILNK